MKHIFTCSFRAAIILMGVLLSACSMQFISDYDEASIQDMRSVARMVDTFYVMLAEVPVEQRQYQNSAFEYSRIKVELNALKLSQEVRPMNELTARQVQIAIDLWQQDIDAHKAKNGISNFILNKHRKQFNRLFRSMILGEQSKPTN